MSSPSRTGPCNKGKKIAETSHTIPVPFFLPVTSEEVGQLEDRLFKLASDYQRLYGVFMSNGEASPNAARWGTVDIDLPFFFNLRQRVVNLRIATRRTEGTAGVQAQLAFLESQRVLYNNLVGVVASAIQTLTQLRRDLEGPNGHIYQYRGWYYEVIGNNPRSTFGPAPEVREPEPSRAVSNSDTDIGNNDEEEEDDDEDEEERPAKRRKI